MVTLLRMTALALFALATSGCAATMSVSSHAERGLDFGKYRTYAWGQADALPIGDPRLDKNPFFQDAFYGAAERQLASRGLKRSTSGRADLLIHYHATIAPRLDVRRIDPDYRGCNEHDCPGAVTASEMGTIIVDMIDARTNRLVWRGWAQSRIGNMIEDQEKLTTRISESLERMLEQFPPAA
jgi:hypothetical protein